MPDKELQHTGEYKFRLADRATITTEVELTPIVANPRKVRKYVITFVVLIALYFVIKRVNFSEFINTLPPLPRPQFLAAPAPSPIPSPSPAQCCYKTRDVIVRSLGVYVRPNDDSDLLHILHWRDSVQLLDQSHHYQNGEIWILVGYKYAAFPAEQNRRGWVISEGISQR